MTGVWQIVAQLLTAGGFGAVAASMVQSIPAIRKSRAESEGIQAGTVRAGTELEIEMVEASREQVTFLRAELAAMRTALAESREDFLRTLAKARTENDQLSRDLIRTRAEVSTLRGVVAALRADLDATRALQRGADMTQPDYGQPDYGVLVDARSAAFLRNPDAIIIVTRSGAVLDANEQAEMITGRARSDLVGQSLEDLVPASHRERHREHMAGFFASPGRRVMGQDRDVAIVQRDDSVERVIAVRIHLAAAAIPSLGLVAIATIHQVQSHWSAGGP